MSKETYEVTQTNSEFQIIKTRTYENSYSKSTEVHRFTNMKNWIKSINELLAELKAENERLKEYNKSKLVELFDEENKKLKQQLKEKCDEIVQLEKDLNRVCIQGKNDLRQRIELETELKTNTHQVCEKIREKFSDGRSHNWGIEQVELYDFLDQIEKGDGNGI